MGKMLAAYGALAGVLGLFLPFIEVSPRYGTTERIYGISLWADTSFFDVGDETTAYLLLAAWILVGLVALHGIATAFGRPQALVTLLLALPAGGTAVYWTVQVVVGATPARSGSVGAGLILLCVAGFMAVLGSCLSLARPERREASPALGPSR